MSKSLNSVELIGHIGRDPESVSFKNKVSLVRFPLATHEVWRHPEKNEVQTHTDWHRIVVRGKQVPFALAQLKKGALLYLRGKLRTRHYRDREDRPCFITEIWSLHFMLLNAHVAVIEEPESEWINHDNTTPTE